MMLTALRRRFLWQRCWALLGLGILLLYLTACQSTFALAAMAPDRLLTQMESPHPPVLLDVRSPQEYAAGHIPGAINIPYREVPARIEALTAFKDQTVVVYCEVGVRAQIAELALQEAGFEQVQLLAGHMRDWRTAGRPVATPTVPATP